MPSAEFEKAAADVQQLKVLPKDDELLKLYALYKQATVGDNETAKPSVFDFKAKYKWSEWSKLKGMAQADAETEYIKFATELIDKYSN
ncbi:acyl-CoA-binding protein [Lipomyces orientalis]|uniref:Acyl-CoA-binding protein n=1 Tax=Lipomyces orientalis TaxID=1233043 RepID=A0ACC3TYI7_9ASCO